MAPFLILYYGDILIGVIKGDVRYTYLSQMLDDAILSNKLEDFKDIDGLILPFNGIDNNLTIKGTNINILDIINNNSIKYIITGNANNALVNICSKYNIKLYEMLNDMQFIKDNSLLTAKGLVYFIHRDDYEIGDLKVLILGYGNVSFYLCELFKVYKVDFDIYVENSLEKKFANLMDYNVVDEIKVSYDLIINTIPRNLDFDYNNIKNSRVIDIASFPYGFDIDKIVDNDIKYELISSIPSKYSAKSSAKIIKKFLENIENELNIV